MVYTSPESLYTERMMLNKPSKAVFIGAHTDDEMLLAGTLHKLSRLGSEVHVITAAPAATREDRRGTEKAIEKVLPEWNLALDIIGVGKNHRQFYSFTPSADLYGIRQELCQRIFDFCEKEKPDIVFTLSPEDENPAHAIVGIEVERVTRGRVSTTLRCPMPWNFSHGRPNLYVSLEKEDLEVKRQVIRSYASQQFRYRYEEMLMSYVIAQGLSVKREAAEVFEVVRSVL